MLRILIILLLISPPYLWLGWRLWVLRRTFARTYTPSDECRVWCLFAAAYVSGIGYNAHAIYHYRNTAGVANFSEVNILGPLAWPAYWPGVLVHEITKPLRSDEPK
jgi:hypothetical protein